MSGFATIAGELATFFGPVYRALGRGESATDLLVPAVSLEERPVFESALHVLELLESIADDDLDLVQISTAVTSLSDAIGELQLIHDHELVQRCFRLYLLTRPTISLALSVLGVALYDSQGDVIGIDLERVRQLIDAPADFSAQSFIVNHLRVLETWLFLLGIRVAIQASRMEMELSDVGASLSLVVSASSSTPSGSIIELAGNGSQSFGDNCLISASGRSVLRCSFSPFEVDVSGEGVASLRYRRMAAPSSPSTRSFFQYEWVELLLSADARGIGISAELHGVRVSLQVDNDSFVAAMVGQASVEANLILRGSSEMGLSVELRDLRCGGSVSTRSSLGPLSVEMRLAPTEGDGLGLACLISVEVRLGVINIRVREFGFAGGIEFGGTRGPLTFRCGLTPPSGLGLSIAAGPIHGGGFIAYDEPLGRYTGALALSIGSIALRAVGILDTRAPGVSGYSFLIVISAEFSPIQLGFGFTLNGVGGLCGIQRSVSVSALQSGVRDGSLTPLLFARDPIAQASQLVTGLQRIFPPTSDRYIFGPMFKLGWGTPTLLTADVGIVLQIPSPIVIALLGTLSATLPKPEAAVVVLHLDIVGVLEVTEKRLSIDASLRDSRIAAFTLTGDMALRFSWGAAPDFALSVGGFNPAFRPPTGFPTLRRLSLALGSGANPRLSLAAYFALTSNSLQFGARAELYATALGFTVQGYLEFHALFIFRPFSFRFDFAAGLSLKRGSSVLAAITVTGQLRGPRPWYIKATASITVLFFDVSVEVERTFGEPAERELAAPVDVWARLRPALEDVRNWSATLPEGRPRGVSTAADRETPPRVRLDPMSRLAVRQKVLPLDQRITKLGEAVIPAPVRYRIRGVQVGVDARGEGGTALTTDALAEPFAAAQYQNLSDAERLSRPSFEPMAAGVEARGDAVRAGGSRAAPTQWRTLLLEPAPGEGGQAPRSVSGAMARKMGALDASKDAGLRATGMERFAPPEGSAPSAVLAPEAWTIASTRTLDARPGTEPSAAWGRSAEALRTMPAGEQMAWQMVPVWEARR